jgi:hypothetical protein
MTGNHRSSAEQRPRYSVTTLIAVGGCALFCLCFYGLNHLFFLMEDEGTESWTVNAGPLGILGCVIFLTILFFFAVSLITYAVHSLVPGGRIRSRAQS